MAANPLLRLEGVSKRFGAVQALSDVDFECDAGEVVALVGDNGAGKSTLVKVIAGTQPADTGHITFDGEQVHITTPQAATALGIATVYQDLALCDNLDVVANLYVGHERARGFGRNLRMLDEIGMEREALGLLDRLAVRIPSVRTEVASLSGGQRQSIAVARATMGDPKLVILSIGHEQKVEIGHELTISRGDRLIGKVKVLKVFPDEICTEILSTMEGEEIQKGDKASTSK